MCAFKQSRNITRADFYSNFTLSLLRKQKYKQSNIDSFNRLNTYASMLAAINKQERRSFRELPWGGSSESSLGLEFGRTRSPQRQICSEIYFNGVLTDKVHIPIRQLKAQCQIPYAKVYQSYQIQMQTCQ